MMIGASNLPLVFFLIVLGVTLEEVRSYVEVLSETSSHFANNETLKPNSTWSVEIKPPNATYIFVVLEEIILDDNDSLSISGDDKTLNETKGTHDPFSFLFEGENVTLELKISADDMAYREFAGYYTISGCTYQLNETTGKLSTPQLYIKSDTANCSFSASASSEMASKVSVTFLEFQLNKSSRLHIIADETHSYKYTGSSIPPEIISEKMELSFMLHRNDTAKFFYERVLKESAYIVLNSSRPSHKFFYHPSPEKTYYPSQQECHWVIQSDENTTISLLFSQASSDTATYILINDGKNSLSETLYFSFLHKNLKYRYISSSGNFLWISIEEPEEDTLILCEATMHKNGGYRTSNGKLSVPLNSTKVVYLLEEKLDENVLLSQHKGTLTSNSTIYVYDDFYTSSAPIAVFHGSLPSYPIVSSTSKMMVLANNFGKNATYEASYEAVKKDCYKMSVTENGQYDLTGNCNATCKWIVPPVKAMDKVISLHLHPIKLEKHDVIILHLLDAKQTMIANITSNKELPEFYLPLSSGFLLNSRRGNCSASPLLHATFEKKKGCSSAQELSPGTSVSVKSPNFPDRYPFRAHCWTNITATKTTKNGRFLLTFNKIDLAATHCLRIRSNVRNSSEVIETYGGTMGALPGDLIIDDSASIEFLAQPCNSTKKELPNTTASSGFHLDILSADCGGKLALKEGNFSTPDFPKNTSASICIWLLEVPEKEIINFTLNRNITTKDVEFKIYDGPSIHNETMKNHSALTLLSRTNSLIFMYQRNSSSGTSPGIQVTFHSQECSSRCENGLCIHDDWRCNGVDDCGDNTDELDCSVPVLPTTTPAPPPPEKSYGVSPVALGLGIPIAFILGIIATIYLPPLIRRFRSGQYHQFRDVSADA